MYVTSWGAPRTGLPFVLPVSFDKIDNNNNNYYYFLLIPHSFLLLRLLHKVDF